MVLASLLDGCCFVTFIFLLPFDLELAIFPRKFGLSK